jgi:hypothetical protein
MIKKLCLLSLLAASVHNTNAASPATNTQSKEMDTPFPWNSEAQEKAKSDRQELQRRDSFKALKSTREQFGRTREDDKGVKYPDMGDIQKPGDASKQMAEDTVSMNRYGVEKFKKEQEDYATSLKELKSNPSYEDLKDIRKKRQDFDQDAPNPTVRMSDITSEEHAQAVLANQLRGADKYIAYLQGQVRDLRNQIKDLQGQLTRKDSNEDLGLDTPSSYPLSSALPSSNNVKPESNPVLSEPLTSSNITSQQPGR